MNDKKFTIIDIVSLALFFLIAVISYKVLITDFNLTKCVQVETLEKKR